GTPLAEGKELRTIDGRDYVLEFPIRGDVALIGAHIGDRAGNLLYRKTARNFGPVMATAARLTIAEVSRVVDVGDIDPETVVTPRIYVDRILEVKPGPPPPATGPPSTSTAARSTETSWPPSSHATFRPAHMSTWGSANPPWSPTTWHPRRAWCCTPRTACSAWAARPPATTSTPT